MNEYEYNNTPQALYRQGKITRAQLARMLKREIQIMQLAYEVQKESIEKAHTDNQSAWARTKEESDL